MKAALVHKLGEAPRYVDHAEPAGGPDQVIAAVAAASLKNIDRSLLSGKHYGSSQLTLPAVAGIDGVAHLPDGRRVYAGATPPGGFMAERVAVNPAQAITVPDAMDDAQAAALPNPAISAWFALEFAGQIQPGQHVLVLGGTGVTGGLATQLALTQFGAERVVVAGRSRDRLAWATDQGAKAVIELSAGDVGAAVASQHAEHPFDLVLDYLWGDPAEQTLQALSGNDLGAEFHRTRYVQVGEMAGPTITLPAAALRSAGIELVGQGGGSVPRSAFARVGTEILPRLFSLAATGSVSIEVERHPLTKVHEVWDAPVASGTRVVLTP